MNILMFFPGMAEDLPPLLTAATCMKAHHAEVMVLVAGCASSTRAYLEAQGVRVSSLAYQKYPRTAAGKVCLRLRMARGLHRLVCGNPPDVLWFHGAHAMAYRWVLRNALHDITIVAHAHEFCDAWPHLDRTQNDFVRRADLCLVPEKNRAWMIRVASQACCPFLVIPNRPPLEAIPGPDESSCARELFVQHGGDSRCRQFIIYQGLMDRDRCVSEIVQAFKLVTDEKTGLILMGGGPDADYRREIAELARSDTRVVLLDSIAAPQHLRVTQGCVAGIIMYAPSSLNNVYCAPNKIYEYASFGLAMVMPHYPGLSQMNGQFHLGSLCDPMQPQSIADAMGQALQKDRIEQRKLTARFLEASPTAMEAYAPVIEFLARGTI